MCAFRARARILYVMEVLCLIDVVVCPAVPQKGLSVVEPLKFIPVCFVVVPVVVTALKKFSKRKLIPYLENDKGSLKKRNFLGVKQPKNERRSVLATPIKSPT